MRHRLSRMLVALGLTCASALTLALAADPGPVGQPAPGFALKSADNATIDFAQARGRAVVLVFYRGVW